MASGATVDGRTAIVSVGSTGNRALASLSVHLAIKVPAQFGWPDGVKHGLSSCPVARTVLAFSFPFFPFYFF